jgi:hypothetical protein
VLGLCCVGAGCNLAHIAAHNVCQIPREWWQDHLEDKRNLALAREAWLQASAASGGTADKVFMDGFVDGYTDYLKFGGTGEPPPLPPHKLRREQYCSPNGRADAVSWFAGFRHGANWARSSGLRMNTVYPLAVGHHPCAGNPYAPVGTGPYPPPFAAAASHPTSHPASQATARPAPEDRVTPSMKITGVAPAVAPFSLRDANLHLGQPQPKREDDTIPAAPGPALRLPLQKSAPLLEGTDG